MVDLMNIMAKGYYVAGSDASSSIKKLLLPTMRHSKYLKRMYIEPTYCGKNFNDRGRGYHSFPVKTHKLPIQFCCCNSVCSCSYSRVVVEGPSSKHQEEVQRSESTKETMSSTGPSMSPYQAPRSRFSSRELHFKEPKSNLRKSSLDAIAITDFSNICFSKEKEHEPQDPSSLVGTISKDDCVSSTLVHGGDAIVAYKALQDSIVSTKIHDEPRFDPHCSHTVN